MKPAYIFSTGLRAFQCIAALSILLCTLIIAGAASAQILPGKAVRGEFTLQQKSTGLYLDAHINSKDNSVVMRNRQDNDTQVWILRLQGGNTYTLQQKSTGLYLDAHEGVNDNSVVTRNRQNNNTQQWIISGGGANGYIIQQKSSRRHLDAWDGSNDNSVVTRDAQQNDTQRWVFRHVATGANAAGCEPGPKQVSFFQHNDYKGACSVLGIGQYPNSRAMGVKNDSISSIKIGSQVTVTVCKHSNTNLTSNDFFKNNPQKCQTLKSSYGALKYKRIGNDSISSAEIVPVFGGYSPPTNGACKPAPNQAAVAVYQHPDYKGSCRLLSLGRYNNSREMNFKNDSISSIEFGNFPKVEIWVFQDNNRNGRVEGFRESVSNLYKSNVGDNAISSIDVLRKK